MRRGTAIRGAAGRDAAGVQGSDGGGGRPRALARTGAAIAGGGAWQPANPRDEQSKGEWWRVYRDAELDALLARIDVSNQNVKTAEAQMAQARAMVKASRAAECADRHRRSVGDALARLGHAHRPRSGPTA